MKKLVDQVKIVFGKYIPGHDIKHTLRVAALARKIARSEEYDKDEAEAAGLVHDFGRTLEVSEEEHAEAGLEMAREALEKYTDFKKEAIERVIDAVAQHSNKTSVGKLANILQDADKLDGLGAMGILRGYISKADIEDYDLELKTDDQNVGRKVKSLVAQLRFQMEWYEMLYTKTAKLIGKERYLFMVEFLERLKQEIEESEFDPE